jgi:hypothetical protein
VPAKGCILCGRARKSVEALWGCRRVISAVGGICREEVCGPVDWSCQAARGDPAVAHLPAMRWGWGSLWPAGGEVSPIIPAFGRLYLLVRSVRAAPGICREWRGPGGRKATSVPQMHWVAAGKTSP